MHVREIFREHMPAIGMPALEDSFDGGDLHALVGMAECRTDMGEQFRILQFDQQLASVADDIPALVTYLGAGDIERSRADLGDEPDKCDPVGGDLFLFELLENPGYG